MAEQASLQRAAAPDTATDSAARAASGLAPVAQLAATGAMLQRGPRVSALAATGAAIQRMPVVQRATTFAQQQTIAQDAAQIVAWTEADMLTGLNNRITFNANPAADQALALTFPAMRTAAQAILGNYGNVFAANALLGVTNYTGTGLDNSPIPGNRATIETVRANNETGVEARKITMMEAVATDDLHEAIRAADGQAFRNAKTYPLAKAALDAWELRYFTVKRSKVIEEAKDGAHNGAAQGANNATMWTTGNVGPFPGHMTIYNNAIGPFADYFVTRLTVQADSDQLADEVIPDADVHLTAEVTPWAHGVQNPKIWGNPADATRHAHVIPGTITWNSFVAPLNAAENAVRGKVWTYISAKVAKRP